MNDVMLITWVNKGIGYSMANTWIEKGNIAIVLDTSCTEIDIQTFKKLSQNRGFPFCQINIVLRTPV